MAKNVNVEKYQQYGVLALLFIFFSLARGLISGLIVTVCFAGFLKVMEKVSKTGASAKT
jgi:hypothetical protein